MSLASNNLLYLFAHIPKTGGTSLRVHFQKHLKDQLEFIHLSEKGNKEAIAQNLKPFELRSIDEKNKTKVILGHDVNYQTAEEVRLNKKYRIIVFRDPSSWLVSRYNQAMHERKNADRAFLHFSAWIEKFPNVHSQFNWFTYHYLNLKKKAYDLSINERNQLIINELTKFDQVILLSRLNEKIKPVMHSLQIANLSVRKNVSSVRLKQYYTENEENKKIITSITKADTDFLKKITFN